MSSSEYSSYQLDDGDSFDNNNTNSVMVSNDLHHFQFPFDPFFSLENFSPPSYETQIQSLPNPGFYEEITDFSNSGLKLENGYADFDSPSSFTSLAPEDSEEMIQRSFSTHSFDQKPGFFLQPRLNSLPDVSNFQNQIVGSPEFSENTRRVSSTGDLQKFKTSHGFSSSSSSLSSLGVENSALMEEVNYRIRPYNAEERKQRIDRYKSKRVQRNFTKTIKYACRKTLADNRPRVRGRFARNGELTSEIPQDKKQDNEEDLWVPKFYGDNETNNGGIEGRRRRRINDEQVQYFGPGTMGSCNRF